MLPTERPLENNQHHIVRDWLKSGEDYWLSIDADNPPRNNPLDLVELDKDIIGLPYPIWHWKGEKGERPIYYGAYRHVPEKGAYREWEPREGLQRVDAIGGGCFLIARRVFEDTEMQTGAFLRTTYRDGTVEKGNDIAFCERARAKGWEVWSHFDYPCDHHVEVELNEVVAAFKNLGAN